MARRHAARPTSTSSTPSSPGTSWLERSPTRGRRSLPDCGLEPDRTVCLAYAAGPVQQRSRKAGPASLHAPGRREAGSRRPPTTMHGCTVIPGRPHGHDLSTGQRMLLRPCAIGAPGAPHPAAFRVLAGLFGVQAGLLLYGAHQAHHLRRAVDNRDPIGRAKGILAERFGVDDDARSRCWSSPPKTPTSSSPRSRSGSPGAPAPPRHVPGTTPPDQRPRVRLRSRPTPEAHAA